MKNKVMIRDSKQLQIGKAGEYLVCADLIIKGFIAFPSEQGLPYDVLLDTGDKLLKIQVKTTEKPRVIPQRNLETTAYIFSIKRAGNLGKTRYNEDEIDLFALVCLDTMQIGYVKNIDMPTTINIRVDSLRGQYYDEKGIADYNKCIELQNLGITNKSEIARELGLHLRIASRYLQPNHSPFVTNARYFSDFKRDKQWFLTL
jgi:hypothetical protein